MNILHVIAEMEPAKGGVGQAVRTLVETFSDIGIRNEVVSLDSADATFLVNESALIHAKGPGNTSWCYAPRMKQWLTENLSNFDVIIVHGLWLYNGYAARKAWQHHISNNFSGDNGRFAPRLFVMPHGMLDPYFQKAKGRKLKALRNWIFWKLIERKLVNEADGVLFTCLTELQLARQTFRPYHPKNEIVVGLGTVEPPIYHYEMRKSFEERCPDVGNRPYILFLSRIHEKKGLHLLIQAYRRLSINGINLPLLVIAGPGIESAYGQRLKQGIESEKLSSHFYFVSMLAGDAKWGAFYGCEAFILPSHQENFGIAVVEALACGKPVLISDQVNIWQEIAQASAGMVAGDSIEGCQQLLEQWHGLDKEAKKMMGARARNCYEQNFAVRPAAERLLQALRGELYQQ